MSRFAISIFLILLFWPSLLLAKPIEVLIFPSGAIVTEERTEQVKDGSVTLVLPSVADPASLTTALLDSKGKIGGIKYDSILEPASNYKELEEQIEVAKEKMQALEDSRQSKAMALDYWKQQLGIELESAEDAKKMGQLVLESTEPLYSQISQLEKDQKALGKQINELQRKLSQTTGRQNRKWSITLALKDAGNTATVRYSYRVRNAGWQSLYSLDARPGEKLIRWDWTANTAQSTGVDWENVHLKLATAEPVFTLTPPSTGTWIIREQKYYPVTETVQSMGRAMEPSAPEAALDEAMTKEEEAPVRQEGSLFDIYDLGRRTILAGENYQLDIREGSWPADFTYLSRPLQSPQAFLSAKLEFDELLPMPSGQAAVLVEGVFVGKRSFSLREKLVDIAFGNDPGVAIEVKSERESDESGLINKDRVQQWTWKVTIENNKPHPVHVRIEDAYPQAQDKRIELSEIRADSSSGLTRDESLAFWEGMVAAGKSGRIEFGYKVTYPADMQVDLGR